ncbi:MAG: SdpI family protein [Fimbriimonadaceae bacterium]
MNKNLRLFIGCLLLTGLAAAYTAKVFPQLPDQIPVHFNAAGTPDRYEAKGSGAWLMVYVMAGMSAMFAVLPFLSPKTKSIESFRKTYDILIAGIMLFMLGMHVVTLNASSTGKLSPLGFGLLMCALFGFLGNMLGKVTPNYYVGIRTPWTLESPENWERTHRFAARLSVGASILGAIIILIGGPLLIAMSIVVLSLIVPVGYSYLLYTQASKSSDSPST